MELYTIIAQIINFSVLIFLLNRFLYKPVMRTMEKRRQDIKDRIEETQKKLEESDRLKEEYFAKLQEVERENIVLRKQALDDVRKFKESELRKARDDVATKKDKFNDYLDLEKKNLVENFNENLSDLFVEYSNDVLGVLANSSLQREVVNSFIDKLDGLDDAKVEEINNLKLETVYIYSNSELTEKNSSLIRDALRGRGFKFKNIEFVVDGKLILGIEFKAKSFVFSWNVKELTDNFVSKLNKKLSE